MRRTSRGNGARLRAGLRACQAVTKRPTPTTWTWQAERGPRARTYRLLMSEALALVRRGRIPSVAEVALNAGVSRATAYRFPEPQHARHRRARRGAAPGAPLRAAGRRRPLAPARALREDLPAVHRVRAAHAGGAP